MGRIDDPQDEVFDRIRENPLEQRAEILRNIEGNVGRNQRNNRRDVAKIETLMAKNDAFDIAPTQGPTGIFSASLDSAITAFQGAKGLKTDGLITPHGETIESMANGLSSGGIESDFSKALEPQSINSDCSELEIKYANTSAEFIIAEQNLKQSISKLALFQSNLKAVNQKIEKEILDQNFASKKGREVGGLFGEATAGIVSKKIPGRLGRFVSERGGMIGEITGEFVGPGIEEVADISRGEKTTRALKKEKLSLEQEILSIKTEISDLKMQVKNGRVKMHAARQAYAKCKNGR